MIGNDFMTKIFSTAFIKPFRDLTLLKMKNSSKSVTCNITLERTNILATKATKNWYMFEYHACTTSGFIFLIVWRIFIG